MWFSNTVWTFWNVFFLMFIWIPLACVWVFAIFDVFRHPVLSGLAKACWLVVIVILPLIGTVCYLIFRPEVPVVYGSGVPITAGDIPPAGQYSRAAPSQQGQ